MADVFVSYKGEDADIARVIVRILRAAGISCWWDGDLHLGGNWKSPVLREIYGAKVLLGIWTKNSVSIDGNFVPGIGGISYVESEHHRAGIDKVVGLLFDEDAVPFGYENQQFLKLTDWNLEDASSKIDLLIKHLISVCTPEHSLRRIQFLERELAIANGTILRQVNGSEELQPEKNRSAGRGLSGIQNLATLRPPPRSS